MTVLIRDELQQYMRDTLEVAPGIKDFGYCIIKDETPADLYAELQEIDSGYLSVMGKHMFAFLDTRPVK